jgi:hypothetical protein
MNQEQVALMVVGLAFLSVILRVYRRYFAVPLAHFLLKRGRVAFAMKVKAQAGEVGCGSCGGSEPKCH